MTSPSMETFDLLIGGGIGDMNLECLAVAAEQLNMKVGRFYHMANDEPDFVWPLNGGDAPLWNGRPLTSRAIFQRYDVFTEEPGKPGLDRAMAWYTPLSAWAFADENIAMFNRNIHAQAGLKPFTLIMAERHGLVIPSTLIANRFAAIQDFAGPQGDAIVKPVMGGAYTKNLATALEGLGPDQLQSPMPATVQRKLRYPEYRVFVVAGEIHAFRLHSNYIDYRPAKDNQMVYIGNELPSDPVAQKLLSLLATFRCDFCACDFKTDPETGEMVFLELNTGPMFAAFDATAQGALCEAMVRCLCM